jgi:hypothetical protein
MRGLAAETTYAVGSGFNAGEAGGVDRPGRLHRFSQATAYRPQDSSRNGALRLESQAGGFAGEFDAAVEFHAGFAEKLDGKTHVFGAVDAPEPEFFFVALEKIERFLELFHGAIE